MVNLDEILLSIMVLRSFFILRAFTNYSHYTDPYSRKLSSQYGFDSNIGYALLC